MRVVLDTNVVLPALVFKQGTISEVRHLWQAGKLTPLISKETVEELIRVLSYPKFHLSSTEQEALLAEYLPYCESVLLSGELGENINCRNPHDLPFLRLALQGSAEALVSGDRDLLEMAADFPVPILTAAKLLEVCAE